MDDNLFAPKEKVERLQRHELSSFYQGQITALSSTSLQTLSALGIVITVAAIMSGGAGIQDSQRQALLAVSVALGVLMALFIAYQHVEDAGRVNTAYLKEHMYLFPDLPPVRLVSFLLWNKH